MSSATNLNILQLIRNRELNDHIRTKYTLKSNMDYKFISNFGLLSQLEGHQENVTCLQWNKSGSTLASVSKDRQIILWDPFLQKIKTTMKTSHHMNILSVKFIPGYNDDILATASADRCSHIYDVTTSTKLSSCDCFYGEVRSLAVAYDMPSLYWCASGDGYISQHDIRMRHLCSIGNVKNTLVKICGNSSRWIGPICLDINQIRSEQFAVGASDQYVRLYDRRMIQSLSSFYMKQPSEDALVYDGNNVNNALQYFLPGHIQPKDRPTITQTNYGITHLTFSPDGQELLVNYGCEYVYLYDLVNRVDNAFFNIHKVMKVLRENKEVSSTNSIDDGVPVPHLTLPDKAVQLKLKANDLFEKEEYTAAIVLYNEAINIHSCSELFSNRAAAYIKRKWQGDFYAALKDCVTALKLEPNHMEAHFQLAVSLFELDKLTDSKMCLDQFITKYPSYKTSAAYNCLNSDLLNAQSNSKGKQILEMSDTSKYVPVRLLIEKAKKTAFEKYFRNQAKDYRSRYIGRSNDYCIYNREANFFGSQNQFIIAGSDDGLILLWEKNTEKNLLTLDGGRYVVNCIRPHPSEFLFATSSIGSKVKLWSPLPDDVWDNTR